MRLADNLPACCVQSKKMEKLLAALNLPQVGEIRLVDPDDESYEEENDGSLFTIELNDRVYTMKVCVRCSIHLHRSELA